MMDTNVNSVVVGNCEVKTSPLHILRSFVCIDETCTSVPIFHALCWNWCELMEPVHACLSMPAKLVTDAHFVRTSLHRFNKNWIRKAS